MATENIGEFKFNFDLDFSSLDKGTKSVENLKDNIKSMIGVIDEVKKTKGDEVGDVFSGSLDYAKETSTGILEMLEKISGSNSGIFDSFGSNIKQSIGQSVGSISTEIQQLYKTMSRLYKASSTEISRDAQSFASIIAPIQGAGMRAIGLNNVLSGLYNNVLTEASGVDSAYAKKIDVLARTINDEISKVSIKSSETAREFVYKDVSKNSGIRSLAKIVNGGKDVSDEEMRSLVGYVGDVYSSFPGSSPRLQTGKNNGQYINLIKQVSAILGSDKSKFLNDTYEQIPERLQNAFTFAGSVPFIQRQSRTNKSGSVDIIDSKNWSKIVELAKNPDYQGIRDMLQEVGALQYHNGDMFFGKQLTKDQAQLLGGVLGREMYLKKKSLPFHDINPVGGDYEQSAKRLSKEYMRQLKLAQILQEEDIEYGYESKEQLKRDTAHYRDKGSNYWQSIIGDKSNGVTPVTTGYRKNYVIPNAMIDNGYKLEPVDYSWQKVDEKGKTTVAQDKSTDKFVTFGDSIIARVFNKWARNGEYNADNSWGGGYDENGNRILTRSSFVSVPTSKVIGFEDTKDGGRRAKFLDEEQQGIIANVVNGRTVKSIDPTTGQERDMSFLYINGRDMMLADTEDMGKVQSAASERGLSRLFKYYDIAGIMSVDEGDKAKEKTDKKLQSMHRNATPSMSVRDLGIDTEENPILPAYVNQEAVYEALGKKEMGTRHNPDSAIFFDPSTNWKASAQMRGAFGTIKGMGSELNWRSLYAESGLLDEIANGPYSGLVDVRQITDQSGNQKKDYSFYLPMIDKDKTRTIADVLTLATGMDYLSLYESGKAKNSKDLFAIRDRGGKTEDGTSLRMLSQDEISTLKETRFRDIMDSSKYNAIIAEGSVKNNDKFSVMTTDDYIAMMSGKSNVTEEERSKILDSVRSQGRFSSGIVDGTAYGSKDEKIIRLNADEQTKYLKNAVDFDLGFSKVNTAYDFGNEDKEFIAASQAENMYFSPEDIAKSSKAYAEAINALNTQSGRYNFLMGNNYAKYKLAEDPNWINSPEATIMIQKRKNTLQQKQNAGYIYRPDDKNIVGLAGANPTELLFLAAAAANLDEEDLAKNKYEKIKNEDLRALAQASIIVGQDSSLSNGETVLETRFPAAFGQSNVRAVRKSFVTTSLGLEDYASLMGLKDVGEAQKIFEERSNGAKVNKKSKIKLNQDERMRLLQLATTPDSEGGNSYFRKGEFSNAVARGLYLTKDRADTIQMKVRDMNESNTGDFDGDTVWLYAGLMDESYKNNNFFNELIQDTKATYEARIESDSPKAPQKLKSTLGDEVTAALLQHADATTVMGAGSAVIRNAAERLRANPNDADSLLALVQGIRYYDKGTSEVQNGGEQVELEKQGKKMLIEGRAFTRFLKSINDYSDSEEYARGDQKFDPINLFKASLIRSDDQFGLLSMLSQKAVNKQILTYGERTGNQLLRKSIHDYIVDKFSNKGEAERAATFQWGDIIADQTTGARLITSEDISSLQDKADAWRQDLDKRKKERPDILFGFDDEEARYAAFAKQIEAARNGTYFTSDSLSGIYDEAYSEHKISKEILERMKIKRKNDPSSVKEEDFILAQDRFTRAKASLALAEELKANFYQDKFNEEEIRLREQYNQDTNNRMSESQKEEKIKRDAMIATYGEDVSSEYFKKMRIWRNKNLLDADVNTMEHAPISATRVIPYMGADVNETGQRGFYLPGLVRKYVKENENGDSKNISYSFDQGGLNRGKTMFVSTFSPELASEQFAQMIMGENSGSQQAFLGTLMHAGMEEYWKDPNATYSTENGKRVRTSSTPIYELIKNQLTRNAQIKKEAEKSGLKIDDDGNVTGWHDENILFDGDESKGPQIRNGDFFKDQFDLLTKGSIEVIEGNNGVLSYKKLGLINIQDYFNSRGEKAVNLEGKEISYDENGNMVINPQELVTKQMFNGKPTYAKIRSDVISEDANGNFILTDYKSSFGSALSGIVQATIYANQVKQLASEKTSNGEFANKELHDKYFDQDGNFKIKQIRTVTRGGEVFEQDYNIKMDENDPNSLTFGEYVERAYKEGLEKYGEEWTNGGSDITRYKVLRKIMDENEFFSKSMSPEERKKVTKEIDDKIYEAERDDKIKEDTKKEWEERKSKSENKEDDNDSNRTQRSQTESLYLANRLAQDKESLEEASKMLYSVKRKSNIEHGSNGFGNVRRLLNTIDNSLDDDILNARIAEVDGTPEAKELMAQMNQKRKLRGDLYDIMPDIARSELQSKNTEFSRQRYGLKRTSLADQVLSVDKSLLDMDSNFNTLREQYTEKLDNGQIKWLNEIEGRTFATEAEESEWKHKQDKAAAAKAAFEEYYGTPNEGESASENSRINLKKNADDLKRSLLDSYLTNINIETKQSTGEGLNISDRVTAFKENLKEAILKQIKQYEDDIKTLNSDNQDGQFNIAIETIKNNVKKIKDKYGIDEDGKFNSNVVDEKGSNYERTQREDLEYQKKLDEQELEGTKISDEDKINRRAELQRREYEKLLEEKPEEYKNRFGDKTPEEVSSKYKNQLMSQYNRNKELEAMALDSNRQIDKINSDYLIGQHQDQFAQNRLNRSRRYARSALTRNMLDNKGLKSQYVAQSKSYDKNVNIAQSKIDLINKQLEKETDSDKIDKLKSAKTSWEDKKKENETLRDKAIKESKSFSGITGAIGVIGKSADEVFGRIVSRFGRQLFQNAIQEVKRFVKEWDSAMTQIQMITLKSDDQINDLGDNLIDIAKSLKTSVSTVTSAASELYRQGLSDSEVEERLTDVVKFSTVAGVKSTDATKLITTAINTGLVSTSDEAINPVAAIGDAAATNAAQIEAGVEKAGAAAAVDGTSYGELIAMLTAITATTQLSGKVAGTTLNAIFGRMNKIGTDEIIVDENGNQVSGSAVAKTLKQAGVDLYDKEGNKKSTFDVLKELSGKWEGLSDAEQQRLATQIAGTRQYSNFSAIMTGFQDGDIDQYMETINGSEGIVDDKYESYMDSLNASIQGVKTSFDELIQSLTDQGSLTSILDFISNAISGFANMSSSMSSLIGVVTALAVAYAGLSLMKIAGSLGVNGLPLLAVGAGLLVAGGVSSAIQLNNAAAIGASQETVQQKQEKYEDKVEVTNNASKLRQDNLNEFKTLASKNVENLTDSDFARMKVLNESLGLDLDLSGVESAMSGVASGMVDVATASSSAASYINNFGEAVSGKQKEITDGQVSSAMTTFAGVEANDVVASTINEKKDSIYKNTLNSTKYLTGFFDYDEETGTYSYNDRKANNYYSTLSEGEQKNAMAWLYNLTKYAAISNALVNGTFGDKTEGQFFATVNNGFGNNQHANEFSSVAAYINSGGILTQQSADELFKELIYEAISGQVEDLFTSSGMNDYIGTDSYNNLISEMTYDIFKYMNKDGMTASEAVAAAKRNLFGEGTQYTASGMKQATNSYLRGRGYSSLQMDLEDAGLEVGDFYISPDGKERWTQGQALEYMNSLNSERKNSANKYTVYDKNGNPLTESFAASDYKTEYNTWEEADKLAKQASEAAKKGVIASWTDELGKTYYFDSWEGAVKDESNYKKYKQIGQLSYTAPNGKSLSVAGTRQDFKGKEQEIIDNGYYVRKQNDDGTYTYISGGYGTNDNDYITNSYNAEKLNEDPRKEDQAAWEKYMKKREEYNRRVDEDLAIIDEVESGFVDAAEEANSKSYITYSSIKQNGSYIEKHGQEYFDEVKTLANAEAEEYYALEESLRATYRAGKAKNEEAKAKALEEYDQMLIDRQAAAEEYADAQYDSDSNIYYKYGISAKGNLLSYDEKYPSIIYPMIANAINSYGQQTLVSKEYFDAQKALETQYGISINDLAKNLIDKYGIVPGVDTVTVGKKKYTKKSRQDFIDEYIANNPLDVNTLVDLPVKYGYSDEFAGKEDDYVSERLSKVFKSEPKEVGERTYSEVVTPEDIISSKIAAGGMLYASAKQRQADGELVHISSGIYEVSTASASEIQTSFSDISGAILTGANSVREATMSFVSTLSTDIPKAITDHFGKNVSSGSATWSEKNATGTTADYIYSMLIGNADVMSKYADSTENEIGLWQTISDLINFNDISQWEQFIGLDGSGELARLIDTRITRDETGRVIKADKGIFEDAMKIIAKNSLSYNGSQFETTGKIAALALSGLNKIVSGNYYTSYDVAENQYTTDTKAAFRSAQEKMLGRLSIGYTSYEDYERAESKKNFEDEIQENTKLSELSINDINSKIKKVIDKIKPMTEEEFDEMMTYAEEASSGIAGKTIRYKPLSKEAKKKEYEKYIESFNEYVESSKSGLLIESFENFKNDYIEKNSSTFGTGDQLSNEQNDVISNAYQGYINDELNYLFGNIFRTKYQYNPIGFEDYISNTSDLSILEETERSSLKSILGEEIYEDLINSNGTIDDKLLEVVNNRIANYASGIDKETDVQKQGYADAMMRILRGENAKEELDKMFEENNDVAETFSSSIEGLREYVDMVRNPSAYTEEQRAKTWETVKNNYALSGTTYAINADEVSNLYSGLSSRKASEAQASFDEMINKRSKIEQGIESASEIGKAIKESEKDVSWDSFYESNKKNVDAYLDATGMSQDTLKNLFENARDADQKNELAKELEDRISDVNKELVKLIADTLDAAMKASGIDDKNLDTSEVVNKFNETGQYMFALLAEEFGAVINNLGEIKVGNITGNGTVYDTFAQQTGKEERTRQEKIDEYNALDEFMTSERTPESFMKYSDVEGYYNELTNNGRNKIQGAREEAEEAYQRDLIKSTELSELWNSDNWTSRRIAFLSDDSRKWESLDGTNIQKALRAGGYTDEQYQAIYDYDRYGTKVNEDIARQMAAQVFQNEDGTYRNRDQFNAIAENDNTIATLSMLDAWGFSTAAQALKELNENGEISIDTINAMDEEFKAASISAGKYGNATDTVKDRMKLFSKDTATQVSALKSLNSTLTNISQNKYYREKYRSGARDSTTLANIKEQTGMSENELKNDKFKNQALTMLDMQENLEIKDIQSYVDSFIEQYGEKINSYLSSNPIEIDGISVNVGEANITTISSDDAINALNAALNEEQMEFISVLEERAISWHLEADEGTNGSWKIVVDSTGTGMKSGGGGGGGGGKSKIDKMIEEQNRKIAVYDHEVKMAQLKETDMDRLNNVSGFNSAIEDEIAAQYRLADAYKAAIAELKEQLSTLKEGSDDYHKAIEQLYKYEEAVEGIDDAISEANKKIFENNKQMFEYKQSESSHKANMLNIDLDFYKKINDTSKALETLNSLDDQYTVDEQALRDKIATQKKVAQDELDNNNGVETDNYKTYMQEIEADEESLAKLTLTKAELNDQRLELNREQHEIDLKSTDNEYNVYGTYKNRANLVGDNKAYEDYTKAQIQANADTIASDKEYVATLEDLLNKEEVGSDEWLNTRDEIWTTKKEIAEKENEQIQLEIELAQQRLNNIKEAGERILTPIETEQNISETNSSAYKTLGMNDAYANELKSQIPLINEKTAALKESRRQVLEELKDLPKYSDEWYNARDAVYEYDEAIATSVSDSLAKQLELEQALTDEVKQRYEYTKLILSHDITMLDQQKAKYEENNQYDEALSVEKELIDVKEAKQAELALEISERKANFANMTKDSENWKAEREAILKLEEEYAQGDADLLKAKNQYYSDRAKYLIQEQSLATNDRAHNRTMLGYEITKYQNNGELTNVNTLLEKDNSLIQDDIDARKKNIESLKEQLNTAGLDEDVQRTLIDAIEKEEEAIAKDTNEIKKNTKAIEENKNKIKQYEKALQDLVDAEIKKRIQEERNQLNAEVSLQNEILNTIKERYQDEWNLQKKDIEKKKQALEEEKNLIDKRLNYRKDAMNKEDKYNELYSLEAQLALISADSTRTKDAKELQKKISDLRKEISWDIADDEAEYAKETLDNEIESYSDYVEAGDENLSRYLEDANNFTAEVNQVLSGSYEEFLDWMKANNSSFKNSLQEAQEQMINSWDDTWKTMKGIVDTYWDEIAGYLVDKDSFIEYMKESTDYKNASESGKSILIYTWEKAYEDFVNSILNDASYEDHIHDIVKNEAVDVVDSNTDWTTMGKDNTYEAYDYEYLDNYGKDPREGVGSADVNDYGDGSVSNKESPTVAAENIEPEKPEPAPVEEVPAVEDEGNGENKVDQPKKKNENHGFKFTYGGTEYASWGLESKEAAEKLADSEWNKIISSIVEQQKINYNKQKNIPELMNQLNQLGIYSVDDFVNRYKPKKPSDWKVYAAGGLVNYTGPAWVDGTPSRPEAFLSSIDTENIKALTEALMFVKVSSFSIPDFDEIGSNNTSVGDINITINQAELKSDADYEEVARKVGNAFTKQLSKSGLNINLSI